MNTITESEAIKHDLHPPIEDEDNYENWQQLLSPQEYEQLVARLKHDSTTNR